MEEMQKMFEEMIEDIMAEKSSSDKNNEENEDDAEHDAEMRNAILQVPALEMERLLVQNARLLALNRTLMDSIVGYGRTLGGDFKKKKATTGKSTKKKKVVAASSPSSTAASIATTIGWMLAIFSAYLATFVALNLLIISLVGEPAYLHFNLWLGGQAGLIGAVLIAYWYGALIDDEKIARILVRQRLILYVAIAIGLATSSLAIYVLLGHPLATDGIPPNGCGHLICEMSLRYSIIFYGTFVVSMLTIFIDIGHYMHTYDQYLIRKMVR